VHRCRKIIGQIRGPKTCYPDRITSWITQSVQVNTETVPQSPHVDTGIVPHITSDHLFPYPLAVTYPITILWSFDALRYNLRHRLINWNWIPKKKIYKNSRRKLHWNTTICIEHRLCFETNIPSSSQAIICFLCTPKLLYSFYKNQLPVPTLGHIDSAHIISRLRPGTPSGPPPNIF